MIESISSGMEKIVPQPNASKAKKAGEANQKEGASPNQFEDLMSEEIAENASVILSLNVPMPMQQPVPVQKPVQQPQQQSQQVQLQPQQQPQVQAQSQKLNPDLKLNSNPAIVASDNAHWKNAGPSVIKGGSSNPATPANLNAQPQIEVLDLKTQPSNASEAKKPVQQNPNLMSGNDYVAMRDGLRQPTMASVPPMALAPSPEKNEPVIRKNERGLSLENSLAQNGSAPKQISVAGENYKPNPVIAKPSVGPIYQRTDQWQGPDQLPLKQAPQFAGAEAGAALTAASYRQPLPTVEVPAYVVKGSMAKDRFSSESLTNLANNIHSLVPGGGGTIKIRLQPENLGELQLSVATVGDNVSLKIQASDHGAKKILEDSMSFLRENLANQNLKLGKVDLGIIQNPGNQSQSNFSSDANLNNNSGNSSAGFQGFNDGHANLMRHDSRQDSRSNAPWDSDGLGPRTKAASAVRGLSGLSAMSGAIRPENARSDGRLDVMA